MQSNSRAFTLIEVLLVCAVVAMLAGLGFSMSGPAREKSRQTTCISNLHQIYTAWAVYSADFQGKTYPHTDMAFLNTSGAWAAFDLNKKPTYMFCPDASEEQRTHMGTSYAMHMMTDIWTDPKSKLSKDMRDELDKLGPLAIAADCADHDYFYYAPREQGTAGPLTRMFEIRLRFDGSTAKVRERRR